MNGTKTSYYTLATAASPAWGTNDLRLGTLVDGRCCHFHGTIGYVAIRSSVPSEDYIEASYANFIAQTFVSFGTVETNE